MKFLKFLCSRLVTFIFVIILGMTAVFLIPRFMPSDPVEAMLGQMTSKSNSMDMAAIDAMRKTLNENFGLEGTLGEQYLGYMKRVIFTQDFGPSLTMYPVPVKDLIANSLPWTLGLLGISTIISWLIGNSIGLLAGIRKDKTYSKILEGIAICIYPIPYYIFALTLIMLFAYIFPIFPLSANFNVSGFSWENVKTIIWNSLLPALSLILTGTGWWVISMTTLSRNTNEEDFVAFARMKGLSERKVIGRYVLPNTILPQITMLALQIGTIFNGALITEILFNYPGIGSLIYRGILQADYNLIMGTITISIFAVTTTTLIVDLLYPFIDPRVRYN
ncbi:ABC transporter permease subunit [Anaerocolumna sedimenticola]|uniref:ABC transporter permease subunit n=1 Tax=Anaerocolumna sedimenticola TaxID=2696063 RepID=A0A6P1TL63_9FIRM|nr:ABC transporter permease [Anaerocolumna sedimenticola]QHQ61027.1 ABC transporter permease subunit [Anaerocolumna sedimenticola]